jgi:hypothetical protein
MYYTNKGEGEYDVYVQRLDGQGMAKKQYEMNSATSMFAINLTGSGVDKSHATFALLMEDSVDELKDLQSAIASYIKANFSDEEEDAKFSEEVELHYGQGDPFIEDAELTVTYNVPTMPIVIKKVKVTKY